MQALFAYGMNPDGDAAAAGKELARTVGNCYVLFLWFFSIFPALAFYRARKLEELKGKHNPTPEDLSPNTKFIDNRIIAQIENNAKLKVLFPQYHIDWSNDMDFIARIFHTIEDTEVYRTYMSTDSDNGYEADRKLIYAIIEEVFADNDHMHWFFGEKNPNWLDDYEEALMMCYKNIGNFKQGKTDDCKILTLFKSADDEDFFRNLFDKTLLHGDEFRTLIERKLQNWEADRVMGMDMLLMKMAICEFTQFPLIPVKVTINEYVDIAKLYSSDKSKQFINGILDKIAIDLRDAGKLNKTGRGLLQN